MKIFSKYTAAALLGAASLTAVAQNTYSGYFIDSYSPRHQMNPAFAPDSARNYHGYVGFPVLSNLNIGVRGNINLTDIYYNRGGETCLFTNPEIPVSTVMNNIHDINRIGASIKLDIINFGFKAFGGWNTVGLNVVSDEEIGVPCAFFSLAKEGIANKNYDIKNMRVTSSNYAELALNHSHDLSKFLPGLRVGATVKLLLGIADFDAYFNRANLILGEDEWLVKANADIYGSGCGMRFKSRYNDKFDRSYFDGVEMEGFELGGFGLGFDLGAQYQWRDFTFSLALLDLGFINWANTQHASTNGTKTFTTDAYTLAVGDNDTWDKMQEGLEDLYQLDVNGDMGNYCKSLKTTLNWGVEYVFPYYRNLSFGLVNTTRFNRNFTWTDFRISANVRPVKCLALSANLAMGTYGVGFGWLANLGVKGFNLFLGMDRTLGKLSSDGYPLSSNASVNFGINFPF